VIFQGRFSMKSAVVFWGALGALALLSGSNARAFQAGGSTAHWEVVGAPGVSAGPVMCCQIESDPRGVVHVAYQDDALGNNPASVRRFANGAWQYVGPQGSASLMQAWYNHIAFDGRATPHVVNRDYGVGGRINVRRFDVASGQWTNLGVPGPSAGEAHYTDIAIAPDGTTYVAYADRSTTPSDRATVLRYAQGSWSVVGAPGFSDGNAEYVSIAVAPDGTPFVAFGDRTRVDGSNTARVSVMQYDTAQDQWIYVGSPGFSPTGGTNVRIAFDRTGAPCVVYQQYHIALRVLRYNGDVWQPIGGSATGYDRPCVETESWRQWLSLAFDSQNAPYVAYQRFDDLNKATVRKFDGTAWVAVGAPGFSPPNADYMAMTVDAFDVPWVIFRNSTLGGRATVMRFAPSPYSYCTASTDAIGCSPRIVASSGTAQGASITTLSASGVVPGRLGRLLYSSRPGRMPFSGGTLCVASPFLSMGNQNSGGDDSGSGCTGALSVDFAAFVRSGIDPALEPGTVVFAQFWYRDPYNAAGAGLTDALRFEIGL
jgi:hypothetical protein